MNTTNPASPEAAESMKQYVEILEGSYKRALDISDENEIADIVFNHFFDIFPETRELFDQKILKNYFGRVKIHAIYTFFVDIVKYPDYGETHLAEEFLRHDGYGLRDKEYFFVLLDCFVLAVKQVLGEEWTNEHEQAWSDVCTGMKPLIDEAARIYS
jgi:hemoglobin-like flavoprotein